MAVAYDADTQALNNVTTDTVTFAHTCTGTNLALAVFVALTGVSQTVSSITYNGVGLTLIGSKDMASSAGRIEAWGLAAPASGSNNVVVTLSASNSAWDASAISFTGAHQSGGASTFNSFQSALGDANNTLDCPAVTSATGDLVVDATCTLANDHSSSSGTNRWQDNTGGTNTAGATTAGAASVSPVETYTAAMTTTTAAICGFNVAQAAAAAATVRRDNLLLMGCS